MVVNMVAVNSFCGCGDVLSYCCGLRGGLAVLLVSVCQFRMVENVFYNLRLVDFIKFNRNL